MGRKAKVASQASLLAQPEVSEMSLASANERNMETNEEQPVEANQTIKPRAKRIPVGGARNVLTIANRDPNYFYRWVLDTPGRLEKFREGGYEEVRDQMEVGDPTVDRSSQLGSVVTLVRGLQTLVLMRIPMEWYREDQDAKQDEIDALEESMLIPTGELDYGKVTLTRK